MLNNSKILHRARIVWVVRAHTVQTVHMIRGVKMRLHKVQRVNRMSLVMIMREKRVHMVRRVQVNNW